jgi:hypothetical protein
MFARSPEATNGKPGDCCSSTLATNTRCDPLPLAMASGGDGGWRLRDGWLQPPAASTARGPKRCWRLRLLIGCWLRAPLLDSKAETSPIRCGTDSSPLRFRPVCWMRAPIPIGG